MKTPHPLKEIINAIADGAPVELRHKGSARYTVWLTWRDTDVSPLDAYSDLYEWRIKPQPKPDVFLHCYMDQRGFDSLTALFVDGDNLKLTFDGETGKLKSAEVIS